MPDRFTVSALLDAHLGQIIVSGGSWHHPVRRQQLDRTLETGDSRIESPRLVVRVTEVVPGAAILRPLPSRLSPNGNRAVIIVIPLCRSPSQRSCNERKESPSKRSWCQLKALAQGR